ncbi:MAG: hypothetical protein AAFY34_11785 [Pseudomonadota bacterium]
MIVEQHKSGEIQIFASDEDIEILVANLNHLLQRKTDHFHLFSEGWGGNDIEDATVSPNASSIPHIKFYSKDQIRPNTQE